MTEELQSKLEKFKKENGFIGKGPLSVALVVTDYAERVGLPIDPKTLITKGRGQVRILGKSAVQAVLKKHGITRVLAAEGGRTSRGSLGKMYAYVDFLNALEQEQNADLQKIQSFWVNKVKDFFAGKPFKIKLDSSKGLTTIIREVLSQARERQKAHSGMQYTGAVLQHLVGAKLDCALGKGAVKHHSFSTADSPNARAGDFLIGDVSIHVTTTPNEAVIKRCSDNLDNGLCPMLITIEDGLAVAKGLANNINLMDRIDIFEIEQFVALNLYELARFTAEGRQMSIRSLVESYNQVIDEVETDPSLKLALAK